MTEEEKNKERRKNTSLTTKEWITFIMTPPSFSKDHDEAERKRFQKYGYIKKTEQMKTARFLSTILYGILIYIIFWHFLKK